MFQDVEHAEGIAWLLSHLGWLHLWQGNVVEARTLLEATVQREQERIAQKIDDGRSLAAHLDRLGWATFVQGDGD